ncbi:MAG: histone deacetylase family protein [Gammaproteobacteria bacterium]|nr:histone deacetylase family protein [Gammaproteobacteria bacterium]
MTALFTHLNCLEHDMGERHPERPARLAAVLMHLDETGLYSDLDVHEAPEARRTDLARVHGEAFLDGLEELSPEEGLVRVDPDTAMGPGSLLAARTAAGAAVAGVELALSDAEKRVFCAVRPPGHHAEVSRAMGFCFFNSVAVAAARALSDPGVDRVAILDFDVHHGNGTVAAFMDNPDVLVCSSFQFPFYPYRLQDVDRPNIVNTPLPAGTRGADFRQAVERDWLPALDGFKPELILVSAGFDGHADDPLAGLLLTEEDYTWVTSLITDAANRHAGGRIVSMLEGGYHLGALSRSVAAHIEGLMA